MLVLISGGSGSGKSAFAEDFMVKYATVPLTYIATMKLWDAECERRAERHRQMRAGKGFFTLECPESLADARLNTPCAVLLEDLSNLVANEYFGPLGAQGAEERVLAGLCHLKKNTELTVVVTNELFADGITYDLETQGYLACLASLNRTAAQMADRVYEVVAGIPITWKGASL